MVVTGDFTIQEYEERLGDQFRRVRIARGLDQATLATRADVSVAAVRNLENGRGSSLRTLTKVARALDRVDWLEGFAPEVTVSPLDALKRSRRGEALNARRRVRRGVHGDA